MFTAIVPRLEKALALEAKENIPKSSRLPAQPYNRVIMGTATLARGQNWLIRGRKELMVTWARTD